MRPILYTLIAGLAFFIAAKLGWPWPVVVLPLWILSFQLMWPKESAIQKRASTWLALATGLFLVSAHLVSEILYRIEDSLYGAAVPGPMLSFLIGNQLLQLFWAGVAGIAISASVLAIVIVPLAVYRASVAEDDQRFRAMAYDILGVGRRTWVVNSQTWEELCQLDHGFSRYRGPADLMVQQGYAVITERDGRVNRILGRGRSRLHSGEKISMVVPLFGRHEHVVIKEVPTRSRIYIHEVEISFWHKVIDSSMSDYDIIEIPDQLLRSWSPSGKDWVQNIREICARTVATELGDYYIEQLVPLSTEARGLLLVEILDKINKITVSSLGIGVSGLYIDRIQVPDEVRKQWLEASLGEQSQEATIGDNAAVDTNQSVVCHPILEHRQQVEHDEPFEFLVRVPREATAVLQADHFIGEHKALPSPTPQPIPELEVVLRPWKLAVNGSNARTIRFTPDSEQVSAKFTLSPTELGDGQVRTDFYQNGRRVGTVRRSISVVEKLPDGENDIVGSPSVPIELRTQSTSSTADLELCIEKYERDGTFTLRFALNSPATSNRDLGYHHTRVGEVTLNGTPEQRMQNIYDELSNLARSRRRTVAQNQFESEKRLLAIGKRLWLELIPKDLKTEYWRFRSRVKSLLITSDEPWIPWELLVPYRYEEHEVGRFLCQEFDMARWLSGPGTVDELPAGATWGVAPRTSNLPKIAEEIDFIRSIGILHPEFRPQQTLSSKSEVIDCLENMDLSIMHFACHGAFDSADPNMSSILLTDGRLTPNDIFTRFGGYRARPLIFVNACHGGRTEHSLTQLGGWAAHLISEAHVGAFVGAMWEIDDDLALQFAKTFYTSLLSRGATVAEALRQAREVIRTMQPWNSSWLAYTLYAYPCSTVARHVGDTNLSTNLPAAASSNLSGH